MQFFVDLDLLVILKSTQSHIKACFLELRPVKHLQMNHQSKLDKVFLTYKIICFDFSQSPHLVLIFPPQNKLPPQPSCGSQLSPKPRCIHKSGLFKWNEIHFSGLNFVLWFPRGAHSGPFPFKWLCSVTLAYISLCAVSLSLSLLVCVCVTR